MEKAKDDYFAEWCKEYINDATESYEFSLWMLDFVQGPNRNYTSWPIYHSRGYCFHTHNQGKDKKTQNYGVYVRGTTDTDYYGLIDEIMMFQYHGAVGLKAMVFKCRWFDTTIDRRIRKHPSGRTDVAPLAPEYSPRHAMDSNHRHFDRRRPRPSESAPAELNHRRVTPGAVPNGTVPPGATRSPSPASSHANNYSQRTLDALLSASERESQPHLHPRKLNGALWFGIDPSVYKFVRTTWQSNFVGPWKNWSDQHYYWETRFYDTVYSLWRKETMTSIGDRISKKKGKKKKTKYIGQTDWDFLMEYWDTTPAQKKSKSAANSRMSNPLNKGIHKHCAGPIPFLRIEYDMRGQSKNGYIYGLGSVQYRDTNRSEKPAVAMSQNLENDLRIYGKVMDELVTTQLALNAIMKSLRVTIIPPELVARAATAGLGVHGSAGGRDGSPAPIASPAPTTSPAVSPDVSHVGSPTVPSTKTQQSPLDAWCASLGFCISLEFLAFEVIPSLRERFIEEKEGADAGCPRSCKVNFKRIEMKGFTLEQINNLQEVLKTFDDLKHALTDIEKNYFKEHPSFKHIYHLPSGYTYKLMGMWMLLLRTTTIEQKKEVWFIVNGVPIRYDNFNGVVLNTQSPWPVLDFCMPLEFLAFEAIPSLRERFIEEKEGADAGCPRMCKVNFKRTEMKGFTLEQIDNVLGTTELILGKELNEVKWVSPIILYIK
ncbi:putative transposase Ptta/En/Spm plant [Arabidopsis thaliana x Arabidopsis arenosa]|uniref:Putative transposase Ptta/En/Spm plant n=1 Tax=Arabidopsis thaliana x Arabidopsis arenosa TaxID=1240361 RepID=A0A8T2EX12_9BRAS|nr:putative transposase Ptta/En/Spm plant [Arabidopsis thaliana x Arabidopsis arenosa]